MTTRILFYAQVFAGSQWWTACHLVCQQTLTATEPIAASSLLEERGCLQAPDRLDLLPVPRLARWFQPGSKVMDANTQLTDLT